MSQRCPKCGERLPRTVNFVSPSHGHQTVASVIAFVSIYGGVFFLVFHKLWPPDLWPWAIGDTPRLALGSAMFGVWLAIDGLLMSTALWKIEQYNPPPEPRDNVTRVEFAAIGRYTMRRLPDGVEQFRLWQYMVAIAVGRVTLSQGGAAEHGFDRDQSNEIKEWLIAVGWWEWISESNATGRWTDEGQAVLAMLARNPPALWNEIIDRPALNDDMRYVGA